MTLPEAIEQIDIGGPTLVRAAAKNHAFTTIATDARQYSLILDQVVAHGCTTLELRRQLAGEAFVHTAAYDRVIADYFAGAAAAGPFPSALHLGLKRKSVLRYGENPHQQAALYSDARAAGANLVTAKQLHGKELSFNNLLDLDGALAIVRDFDAPAAAVIKHNNPCGAAVAGRLDEALRRALAGDPLSAYGSVLGLNRRVDAATAEVLCAPGLFVEAVVAPDFEPQALEILTTKPKWRANVRLMKVGDLDRGAPTGPIGASKGACSCKRPTCSPIRKINGKSSPTPAPPSANGRPAAGLGAGAARQVERHRGGQGPSCCWAPAPGK